MTNKSISYPEIILGSEVARHLFATAVQARVDAIEAHHLLRRARKDAIHIKGAEARRQIRDETIELFGLVLHRTTPIICLCIKVLCLEVGPNADGVAWEALINDEAENHILVAA